MACVAPHIILVADNLAEAIVRAIHGGGDEIFDGARAFLSDLRRHMEFD